MLWTPRPGPRRDRTGPRTLLERKARTAPSWLPVMAPLTLAAAGLTVPRRLSSIFSMAGLSITAKLWVLALAQDARSTTSTDESRRSRAASSPVIWWTWCTDSSARRRRLSTASPISAEVRVGPAGASRAAVDAARSQLIRAWAGLDDAGADESRAVVSIVPIRTQQSGGSGLKFAHRRTVPGAQLRHRMPKALSQPTASQS